MKPQEINWDEWEELKEIVTTKDLLSKDILMIRKTGENYYFKKKEKFPIVFEDPAYTIEVDKDGHIAITQCGDRFSFSPKVSLPLLYKAVKKSQELRK